MGWSRDRKFSPQMGASSSSSVRNRQAARPPTSPLACRRRYGASFGSKHRQCFVERCFAVEKLNWMSSGISRRLMSKCEITRSVEAGHDTATTYHKPLNRHSALGVNKKENATGINFRMVLGTKETKRGQSEIPNRKWISPEDVSCLQFGISE